MLPEDSMNHELSAPDGKKGLSRTSASDCKGSMTLASIKRMYGMVASSDDQGNCLVGDEMPTRRAGHGVSPTYLQRSSSYLQLSLYPA